MLMNFLQRVLEWVAALPFFNRLSIESLLKSMKGLCMIARRGSMSRLHRDHRQGADRDHPALPQNYPGRRGYQFAIGIGMYKGRSMLRPKRPSFVF